MSARTRGLVPQMRGLLSGDLAFAGLVVAVVAMLVVPLPTPVLDVLLTANIALAAVLLLTALYVPHPLRLSTFPSILLVATLFRLALNVSSTRLILGQADAGRVIESFGDFVVRGNYVVGAVIFVILTVIQFLVIAKGSERVAEVAARFTLDAMPGKQMSIDADLRAGAYTLVEARRRRAELQRESQLFGAMDGAMKFVKGDAIAGILITLVNIGAGLVIGVMQRGMTFADAAQVYTLLTVGDGLVSQIPALLVSICAGLIVTRVGSADDDPRDLGNEVIEQLASTPRVFGIASVLLVGLGLVPGLPTLPFVMLGAGTALIAGLIARRDAERDRADLDEATRAPAPGPSGERAAPPAPIATPVTLELGAGLSEALRQAGIGDDDLRDEIGVVRDALFQRLGVRLPPVRIRSGVAGLAEHGVRVQIFEVVEAAAEVDATRDLVVAPPEQLRTLGLGEATGRHPVTGTTTATSDRSQRDALRQAGVDVLAPERQVMLWLAAAAQRSAERFIGRAEVQAALDQLEPTHGALIDAVVPRPVTLARLTGVLKRLVGEGVSVRDLRAVLEALAEDAREEHDVVELTEIARRGLARSIMATLAPSRVLRVWMLSPAIEQTVREAIRRDVGRPSLALPPRVTDEILRASGAALAGDPRPLVLTQPDVRRYVRQLLALQHPGVVVVGAAEVHDGIRLEAAGTIQVGGAPR